MSIWLNTALFGWYPYVCLTVFLLGSLLRFDRVAIHLAHRLQPVAAPAAADAGAPTCSMSACWSSSPAISSAC